MQKLLDLLIKQNEIVSNNFEKMQAKLEDNEKNGVLEV